MAEIIEMPKLSDTQTVGTLISWLKKTGEMVGEGEIIAEVETDKATMELESFVGGVLITQYVNEGDEVEIGAPICAIGEAGEEPPSPGKRSPVEPATESPTDSVQAGDALTSIDVTPTPLTEKGAPGDRIKASPLARKIAIDQGIPLEAIVGTGPDGRVVKADVIAAMEKGTPTTEISSALPQKSIAGMPIADEMSVPVSNMRNVIAKRLLESKKTIPHYYLEIEINATPLLELRASLNKSLNDLPPDKGGIKLTINDFFLKACAKAMHQVPAVNVSWMGKSIQQHSGVHIAVAIAVEDGLVTPVVRDVHLKSLSQISSEVKTLADKAKNKKLSPNEMAGSTITTTNLGMFGITSFHAIINPPNSAILSVGAIVKKPVVDDDDNITVGQCMTIGFSGDHRSLDGALGAEYLSALRGILETPALMLI
jgi:pyruvate dehydrogenase E2 component (dihydrolipoamide acetyltransferase)